MESQSEPSPSPNKRIWELNKKSPPKKHEVYILYIYIFLCKSIAVKTFTGKYHFKTYDVSSENMKPHHQELRQRLADECEERICGQRRPPFKESTRWCGFIFFDFHPYNGEDSHFDSYFARWLKAPTRSTIFPFADLDGVI